MGVEPTAAAWHRATRRWCDKQDVRACLVEISIGAIGRNEDIVATIEGKPSETCEEICETLADIHAMETTAKRYTLRARRSDGDSMGTLNVLIPAPAGERAAEQGNGLASVVKALEQTMKHNDALTAAVIKMSADQHAGYTQLVHTLRASVVAVSEENSRLRNSVEGAQSLAKEAIDQLESAQVELKKVSSQDNRLIRVADIVLNRLNRAQDPETVRLAKDVAGAIAGEVVVSGIDHRVNGAPPAAPSIAPPAETPTEKSGAN